MSSSSWLRPLSVLFGAGARLKLQLYRAGIRTVRHAGRPVVSIGNVTAGGTGKTPFVRYLAQELLARGKHPAILTRGYGRTTHGTLVVSRGEGLAVSVSEAGDEASLLARALPGVPIVADAVRFRAATRAESLGIPVDLHLLDDGFSHVGLARNVDIVLLDATDPDAGGDFLPAGRLREPLSSLARADLIVITKCEQADPAAAIELATRHARGVPLFRARTVVIGILDRDGVQVSPADLPAGTVVAVAGLAHPEAFRDTVNRLGISPTAFLPFPDHARYGDFRIGRILRTAEETGATALLTTEKDAVKLEGSVPLPVFRVAIEMRVDELTFVAEVLTRLDRAPS
ncbi:MAG TPA: tetraacyldisaccharide 4'-kinase [Thermoanaerobaculia bacterium]